MRGVWDFSRPRVRRSWAWAKVWIMEPAQMNRRALNSAWVSRWKNAKEGRCRANAPIINPNCLSVDSAITFFRSHSVSAEEPARNIVRVALKRRRGVSAGVFFRPG